MSELLLRKTDYLCCVTKLMFFHPNVVEHL